MGRRVKLSARAKEDLDEVLSHIVRQDVMGAVLVHDRIWLAMKRVGGFPFCGPKVEHPRLPKRLWWYQVQETRLGLVYRLRGKDVEIVRVIRAGKDMAEGQGRGLTPLPRESI